MAATESRFCTATIARRPATCIGPMSDAASTAVPAATPRSLARGRK